MTLKTIILFFGLVFCGFIHCTTVTHGYSEIYNEEEEEESRQIKFGQIDLTSEIIELRDLGLTEAITQLINDDEIPEGEYRLVNSNNIEKSMNGDSFYQFDVVVSDEEGNEFAIVYMVLDDPLYRGLVFSQVSPNGSFEEKETFY